MAEKVRLNVPSNSAPRSHNKVKVLRGVAHPKPRFHLVHYPQNWEWVDGRWIPDLNEMFEVAGVNGAKRVRPFDVDSDEINMAGTIAGSAEKGGRHIPINDPRVVKFCRPYIPEGSEVQGFYGFGYPTDSGKLLHCYPWETVTQHANGALTWNTQEATEVDRKFRAYLVDAGVVDPIDLDIARGILNTYRTQVADWRDRNEGRLEGNGRIARKVRAREALIAEIEAWIEKQEAGDGEPDEDSEPAEVAPDPPKKQIKVNTRGRKPKEESAHA